MRFTPHLLAAGLSVMALAACGGSDESSGSDTSSSSGENDRNTAQVRLTNCLREQGIDVPEQGQGTGAPPTDIDQDELQAALDGPCREEQENAFGDITEEDQQELQDSFQSFAQCMREEGIEVPDIDIGEGPPQGGGGIDMDDPDVQAAQEKCQDELPQGGFGPGAGQ